GNGIYDNGTLTITPTVAGTLTISDVIYLANGIYFYVGSTLTNLDDDLNIQMANPASGQIVAQVAGSYTTFATGDLGILAGYTFVYNGTNTQILIA
ncbi:MAG: hypothetical protein LBT26_01035, partial [Clostridiales Family XIII bacterium]|nr:hypothetical protein [Clostridiales Family XIII bacterium]